MRKVKKRHFSQKSFQWKDALLEQFLSMVRLPLRNSKKVTNIKFECRLCAGHLPVKPREEVWRHRCHWVLLPKRSHSNFACSFSLPLPASPSLSYPISFSLSVSLSLSLSLSDKVGQLKYLSNLMSHTALSCHNFKHLVQVPGLKVLKRWTWLATTILW